MLTYHAAYYRIEDGWYMAKVLDFPGVVTQGRNLNAARRMVRSALKDMAEWYMKDGQAFPKPKSSLKDRKADYSEPIQLGAKVKSGVG